MVTFGRYCGGTAFPVIAKYHAPHVSHLLRARRDEPTEISRELRTDSCPSGHRTRMEVCRTALTVGSRSAHPSVLIPHASTLGMHLRRGPVCGLWQAGWGTSC